MRRLFLLLCLVFACTGAVALRAQQDAPAASQPSAQGAPATVDPPLVQTSSGLPEVAPPPRTLRAYWHVFAAFAVAFTLLFGYALVLGRRFGALERQVERLEGTGV
jgi:CcmD family protein